VYFSNREGTALVPVRRRVPDQQFLPYGAASALFHGPEPSEPAVATIPEGTRLLGLVIRGGTAYVNVSSEFRSHHGGGSTGEILTLYSVVNTLTEFSDVQNVRFMLDGKPLNTFIHMDLSQGLARRQDLIAEP
jgi:germination protein M